MTDIEIDEKTIIKMVGLPAEYKRNILRQKTDARNNLRITCAFEVEGGNGELYEGTAKLNVSPCEDAVIEAFLDRLGVDEFDKSTELVVQFGMRKEATRQTKFGGADKY